MFQVEDQNRMHLDDQNYNYFHWLAHVVLHLKPEFNFHTTMN
jgi:hypothetical protein